MLIYVASLDSEPGRWEAAQTNLENLGYCVGVTRWPAVTADQITDNDVVNWDSIKRDPHRRIAILRTYQTLLQHLIDEQVPAAVILQDSQYPTGPLERDFTRPVHLYGGCRPDRNPLTYHHVCPHGFYATAEAFPQLLEVWSDESRPSCLTFPYYLNPDTATYDNPPTMYHAK